MKKKILTEKTKIKQADMEVCSRYSSFPKVVWVNNSLKCLSVCNVFPQNWDNK